MQEGDTPGVASGLVAAKPHVDIGLDLSDCHSLEVELMDDHPLLLALAFFFDGLLFPDVDLGSHCQHEPGLRDEPQNPVCLWLLSWAVHHLHQLVRLASGFYLFPDLELSQIDLLISVSLILQPLKSGQKLLAWAEALRHDPELLSLDIGRAVVARVCLEDRIDYWVRAGDVLEADLG